MKQDFLHSLLIDVRDRGSVCIEKRKLLWMMGRTNESAGAWEMLLGEWGEVGGQKQDLHGFEWGNFINLMAKAPDNVAEDWAV